MIYFAVVAMVHCSNLYIDIVNNIRLWIPSEQKANVSSLTLRMRMIVRNV